MTERREPPYTEEDAPHPLKLYGQTKLEAEQAIAERGGSYWVFRTSWVCGTRRSCYLTKVLAWAREKETLRVLEDPRGSPTWCRVVAESTRDALERSFARGRDWTASSTGLYRIACADSPSRLEWTEAILAHDPRPQEQTAGGVVGVAAETFRTPAARPRYSALGSARSTSRFGIELPPWRSALAEALRPA